MNSALRLVLLAALLCPVFPGCGKQAETLEKCFKQRKNKLNIVVVGERNEPCVSESDNYASLDKVACTIYLGKNQTSPKAGWKKLWRSYEEHEGSVRLYLSTFHKNKKARLLFLSGATCKQEVKRHKNKLTRTMDSEEIFYLEKGSCKMSYVNVKAACGGSTYDKEYCSPIVTHVNNRYIVNTETIKCHWCKKPKTPKSKLQLDPGPAGGDTLDGAKANQIMSTMHTVARSINESAVVLSGGDGVEGILLRDIDTDEVDEVCFGYSLNDSMAFTENSQDALAFQSSIIIPKEAFEQALSQHVNSSFVGILKFPNLEKDEMKSTLIVEAFAIEMGAVISNLTEFIYMNYKNLEYAGIPSCRSWNGQGTRPNWTDEGCRTDHDGENVTCSCSHLTFFAVLLTPLNETISTSDLSNLTIITKVGCAISIVFLSVILFMHHLLRRTKVSTATKLIIQLVYAMLLLDLTFLVNEYVATLKNSAGCVAMAAVMHWSMLATFTWFSVQALHLCLQLYRNGQVAIQHYLLKVSLASWVLPGIPVVILLSMVKYGELVITTSEATRSVSMCWITDDNTHLIINIGYYVLVFVVTFTTFLTVLSFLCNIWRSNADTEQANESTRRVTSVMGMCCILGITWSFAFFAHGVLRIPSYYIFTILNSFQGFFLFIYYYNTRQSKGAGGNANSSSVRSVTTLQINEVGSQNPYGNLPQSR